MLLGQRGIGMVEKFYWKCFDGGIFTLCALLILLGLPRKSLLCSHKESIWYGILDEEDGI